MKHLLFILLFVLAIGPVNAQETDNNETTTLYFIRHAEKDRSNPDNKDPHLSEVGVLRALKWSYVFEKAPIDAVYSTAYHRTIETATPTANTKNVDITTYDPRAMDITAFLNDNRGKTVLIVGHSNTTPVLVNQIIIAFPTGPSVSVHINEQQHPVWIGRRSKVVNRFHIKIEAVIIIRHLRAFNVIPS